MTNATTQNNGVLFVGSIMVDVISPVPRLPQSGQGVVAQGAVSRLGGCAFNSANIARQLAGTLAEAGGAACAHGESGEDICSGRVSRFFANFGRAFSFAFPLRKKH